MRAFSLLVKPASADCNLVCAYCFYLDKKKLSPEDQRPRMSDATLQRMLERYFATRQQVYSLTWQGGEPALMGEEFFQRVTDLQKKTARKGSRIVNCIQTNATLITPEMAAHMGKYRFLAGCSMDGPAALHDAFRKTPRGGPTHDKVVEGVGMFRKHGVPVNAVCLVSSANAHRPEAVYDHLTSQGFRHIQFIPCLRQDSWNNGPDPGLGSGPGPGPGLGLTGPEWGEFLLRIFEQWFAGDMGTVSVRNFESILARLVMGKAAECRMADRCDQYLVVEYNGDVYPCDFFVQPGHKLGNVHDDSFDEVLDSTGYLQFSDQKSAWAPKCARCPYLQLCKGDCPAFRLTKNNHASVLCEGWKYFYDKTVPRFMSIARDISGRPAPAGSLF
ncbi:anaerobic sulfatase maturase [Desulfonatronum sp. SC1]|uniref:anaerobic sulfatase maturase n=1 Tax=Desulfonatronum sp. SC1 TaxID=2109626 RepID=UPI000D326622|nr:anaerobic sulfatase maturase [Desulfonatronum sp. SC1]PTN38950.1 anaerobic sulfatase maturase [Desulfonatronum sp. SC1]